MGNSDSAKNGLTRRSFVAAGASMAPAVLLSNAGGLACSFPANVRGRKPEEIAKDEALWANVARAYRLDGRYIILNGGGNNPHPAAVTDALNRYDQLTSTAPRPHNYVFQARLDGHRQRLAKLFDCDTEELAITRNTTEGLNIVGSGLALAPGDEVIISDVDMHYAGQVFEQRAQRHGIVLRRIELPVAPTAIQTVHRFRQALSDKTRLLVASHIADGLGYVLPIRALSDLAHQHGAQLLADGALSFGQIPVSMRELGCDYFATSLHKWLNAPLGTGALFVRRDRLPSLWPLYGTRRKADDIRKFEAVGTRSGPTIAAIGQAIDFYERIGPENKAARVRYLLSLVLAGLEAVSGVRIITEPDPRARAGLARIMVDGMSGKELMKRLRDEFRIFTYGNSLGAHDGVYISPNVFNSAREMNIFVSAVQALAGS